MLRNPIEVSKDRRSHNHAVVYFSQTVIPFFARELDTDATNYNDVGRVGLLPYYFVSYYIHTYIRTYRFIM